MMDSKKVHQSARAGQAGDGVGATPVAWGGFTPLLRQAQDGESRPGVIEPLAGEGNHPSHRKMAPINSKRDFWRGYPK